MLRRRRGRRKIKSGKGILGWGQWTRSWTRRIWSGGPRVGDGRSGTTCVWPLKGNRIGRRVGDLWWSRDPASTLARLGKVSLGLGSKNPERPSGGLGARGAWHARDLAPALRAQAAASGCSALRRSRLSSAPGSLPRGGSPWSGRGCGGEPMRPRGRRGLTRELLRGGSRPSQSEAAARSGAGAEGMGGGSPDPAGGERADRIWSLREARSEVAPCAVGPRGGARLCGGLGPPATPQYLRVCR